MQTKAYFASSVPAALEVARRELGPDAMLVGSRPAPPQVRQFGRLEVTFAWPKPKGSREPDGGSVLPIAQPGVRYASSVPLQPAAGELEDIRCQLRAIRSVIGASVPGGRFGDSLAERLVAAGLDPAVSQDLADAARQQPGDPESNVFDAMVQRVVVCPFTALRPGDSRTIAFIGPPGRGKTTTLVKVAVSKALANRIPVRVYNAGAHGVGGSEQMAHYCLILGSPHQSFESLESLELALQGEPWRGLSLIDTPGLTSTDHEEFEAFAGFFARHEDFEKHLVLRADSRYADMLSVIERFSGFLPDRLLFTGTDETRDWSAMVSTLVRTSIRVTFEGTGQGIPEDLAEVDAVRLVRTILASPGFATASLAQRAVA